MSFNIFIIYIILKENIILQEKNVGILLQK